VDFLILFEWEEPFGMVMIESMAMGLPGHFIRAASSPRNQLQMIKLDSLVDTVDEMVSAIAKID